ncbi:MAG: ABC transporter ATP-binding protein [Anaerocolumna sp.]
MIELKNVYKSYKLGGNSLTVLNDVSLIIEDGEFVSIMGKSGSGKSTLLNILGLLDNHDKGEYILDGRNITKYRQRQLAKLRNRSIGFIFQNFNLMSKLSAAENVALPLMYSGVSNRQAKAKALEYLELVGLGDKAKNRPTQLSGGQQQRVAFARALINEPGIILADEPTGALDSKTSLEIMDLLHKLWDEKNITTILVTHDKAIANEANRMIHVVDGKILS